MTSYNAIPYKSLPISHTYVPFLAALGRLYGLDTPDPAKCSVLELGCAEGSNLIPMAYYWPNSEFVGIDLSEVQIASGQAHIDALALNNIQLHVDDLAQMCVADYGMFDYIVVHGVFSWVPTAIQHRILALGKSLLTEQGMMYISYNTYPGWHQHMVLRDAFKLYCDDVTDPEQKKQKITGAIDYLTGFFNTADNDFSPYYTKRLTDLKTHTPSYIYHEYLEECNAPLYLTDFVKQVEVHGMQYVSDAYLPIDAPMLLGKKRFAYLKNIEPRIKQLQTMDYMINQRFRRSLICHQQVDLQEHFSPQDMMKVAYRGDLVAKGKPSLRHQRKVKYYLPNNPQLFITVSHPVSKAAIQVLSDNFPSSLNYADLLQQACQLVARAGGMAFIQGKAIEPYYHELYLLVIDDWVTLDTHARHVAAIDWQQPLTIEPLILRIAEVDGYMPTFLQRAINVDPLLLEALKLLGEGMLKETLIEQVLHNAKHNKALALEPKQRKPRYVKQRLEQFFSLLESNGLLRNISSHL